MTRQLDGRKVLILEDEALINFDLTMTVEDFGAREVVSVYNIRQAEAAIADQTFDLAVLDLNLPDGDSTGVAEKLNAGRVPIVFYSGHGERSNIEDRFPGAEFLAKPASEIAWRETIQKVMAGGA